MEWCLISLIVIALISLALNLVEKVNITVVRKVRVCLNKKYNARNNMHRAANTQNRL